MYFKSLVLKINNLYNSFTKGINYQYLAFFRISAGIIALADLLSMRNDLHLFFSEKSTIIPQQLLYLFSEYFEYLDPFYNYLGKHGLISFFYDNFVWIYVCSLIFLIFGFFTRFFVIIAIISQLIIFKSFALYNFGYDHFLTMSMFYCLIFPVNKFYSLDNLIFKKNSSLKYTFDYQKFLRIHLAIVYFFAGISKIVAISWWNGEAMWRSVSTIYDDYFKISPIILAVLGIITIIIETFYPLFVLLKSTRKYIVFIMIMMHFGIAVFMDLPMFAAIMIVWDVTSYYDYFSTPNLFNKK